LVNSADGDSLRDLIVSISPHTDKYYHLAFGKNVTRSNLSVANEQRDYKIFEEFAYAMIDRARICSQTDTDFTLDIAGPVYAFDSTVIDLCLSVFWWAEFRTTKAAVKIHTLLDVKTSIPCFVHITNGATHDVHGLDVLKYETGGFYVLDRGYMDFERLFKINLCGAYFVTRAKDNLNFARITSRKVKRKKVLSVTRLSYPGLLRRIRFVDKETEKRFVFITNNFDLTPEDIALLYNYRWKIELFFKCIKQHLKVKSFCVTSPNAVKIQIYTAFITYCLVMIS
jgi:hypothetical protein